MQRLFLVEALPLVLLVVTPLAAHAGVFSTLAGMFADDAAAATATEYVQSAATVPLLRAATHADPNPSKGGGDIIIEAGALVPEAGPRVGDAEVVQTNGEISVYTVREGDSLSEIAAMFGVTTNTILWANDIKSANLIQPNDTLIILPITGVRYVVKEGDTLAAIASKYHGEVEDMIAYNGLASASDIREGQTVVIPGGEVPAPAKPAGSSGTRTPSAPAGGSGYFAHPVPGAVRTQGLHGYNGVDLGAAVGTAVRAAAAGEVLVSRSGGWNGGYGTYVVVKHTNGTQTLYAHNSENYVSAGQYVAQGETIAAVGSTGRSTGAHLHFEVRGATNPF